VAPDADRAGVLLAGWKVMGARMAAWEGSPGCLAAAGWVAEVPGDSVATWDDSLADENLAQFPGVCRQDCEAGKADCASCWAGERKPGD